MIKTEGYVSNDTKTGIDVIPIKPVYQIQIDDLKNKVDELESELGELEDKIELLKELVKTMAELL